MNILDFIQLAKEMRTAQKAFFKSRLPGDVAKAKDLEKRFDKALDEGVTVREFSEPEALTTEQLQARMAFMDSASNEGEPDRTLPDLDA